MKVSKHLSMVSWSWSIGRSNSLWVLGSSLISDISNISVISIGGVGHCLDSAIGKSNGVRSLSISGTIGGFLGVEVGLGVVISNGVGVCVGGNLIRVDLSLVDWGSLVGNWSIGNWGWSVSRASHGGSNTGGQTSEDLK